MPTRKPCAPGVSIIILYFSLVVIPVVGQELDSGAPKKKIEIRGYIKDLQSLTFNKDFDNLLTNNLIHNRINIRWFPSNKITGAVEFRNRMFWGEEVKYTPGFTEMLRNANEAVDLSFLWQRDSSMVWQTNIDRFWLEYRVEKWEVRVGRQRINWGIGTIWNPNDIFNTYNFLDFDYEERPGRDAVKLRHALSDMAGLELAVAASDKNDRTVAAIKYLTNTHGYDIQCTVGLFEEKFTAGAGWAGSIFNVGFKGEVQYFAQQQNQSDQVNLSTEADYLFKEGWYASAGLLFNSKGISKPVSTLSFNEFQLSPQNLMPTKWNSVLTFGKEFTPLLSATITSIYASGTNLLLLLPGLKFNMATNLDVDLVWQSFFAEQPAGFDALSHRAFIRLKWTFN